MKHHDFKRQVKWILTREDWYPSYGPLEYGNPHKFKALRVSMMHLTNREWRVCVWGADDFGMEFDHKTRAEVVTRFRKIKDFTTITDLNSMGFVRA